MVNSGWAVITAIIAVAGFATGILLSSLSHLTIESGRGVGGAATLAILLALAAVPSLARAVRRLIRGSGAPGARTAPPD